MRVCLVGPYILPLSVGGFQSQVYHIYEGLKKLGVDIKWYSLEQDNLEDVDILQVMQADRSMINMMKRARNRGIKIVLTPMHGSRARSNIYLKSGLLLSRIPQFFTTHRQLKETICFADYLTPLCSFEANRMTDVYGFKKDHIFVIPNGLDDVFFNGEVENVELPFKDYLLIVGRVEENKNQLTLIKIAKKLQKNLLIVGEAGAAGNNYLNKCKAEAGDNVYFWGVEKNTKVMKYLYSNAKLTVIPSLSEMVPLVAFESLSQHSPVVCTNRCGITGEEIPGMFFSGVREKDLVDSIITMWNYDRNLITNKGIYTWADIAKKYKSVYESIL